jgi:HSP20 family protein
MRFDPFRELDRLADRALSSAGAQRSMPMEALRRGDEFLIYLDLPGVRDEDVEVTIERNVASIRATREPMRQEGDEVVVDERAYGKFSRQLFLGENLDPSRLTAEMHDGVLNLRIPVSEASKPRRIRIGAGAESPPAPREPEPGRTAEPTSQQPTNA